MKCPYTRKNLGQIMTLITLVEIGVKGIADVPLEISKGIFQHHERFDGSGYPTGAVSGQISEFARAIGLADQFCNLLTGWPDGAPLPAHLAIPNISKNCDRLFGRDLMKHLLQVVGVYPVGTMAKLSNDELAVVTSVNVDDFLRPEVAIVFDRERVFVPKPNRRLDLAGELERADNLAIRATSDLKDFGIDHVDWITQPPG